MPLKVPAVPRDIPDQKPMLLLRRNAETGAWSYKRTNGQWMGCFELSSDAMTAAEERFGWLPGSYLIHFVERDE